MGRQIASKGRPPLTPDRPGKMTFTKLKSGAVQASCRYRPSGQSELVRRKATGATMSAARDALNNKIEEEKKRGYGSLESTAKFKEVAELWMANVVRKELQDTTYDVYRQRLDSVTIPALGGYRVCDISSAVLRDFFQSLVGVHGFHARRSIRSTVSGPLQYAVDRDAIDSNLTRELGKFKRQPGERKPRVTSLSDADAEALVKALDADRYAMKYGLNELVRFSLATGCRIGETLGLVWGDFSDSCRHVDIQRNVVRVKGKGIVYHDGKTDSSERSLFVPEYMADRLMMWWFSDTGRPLTWPVFGTIPREGFVEKGMVPRDPGGVGAAFRRFIRRSGYSPSDESVRMVSHLFRRTAVTTLDGGGMSAREIADQVGHSNPAITQSTYMGRRHQSDRAAVILNSNWLRSADKGPFDGPSDLQGGAK